MKTMRILRDVVLCHLNYFGAVLGMLSLRLILAWEFFESGMEKLRGENWFMDIQDQFPFPFNLFSADINWFLATGFELVGSLALLMGLGTRFFSLSLIVITLIAIFSVHWPSEWHNLSELLQGYVLTDKGYGNFKLPVIFLAMLWPLFWCGPGKLSVDHWLKYHLLRT